MQRLHFNFALHFLSVQLTFGDSVHSAGAREHTLSSSPEENSSGNNTMCLVPIPDQQPADLVKTFASA